MSRCRLNRRSDRTKEEPGSSGGADPTRQKGYYEGKEDRRKQGKRGSVVGTRLTPSRQWYQSGNRWGWFPGSIGPRGGRCTLRTLQPRILLEYIPGVHPWSRREPLGVLLPPPCRDGIPRGLTTPFVSGRQSLGVRLPPPGRDGIAQGLTTPSVSGRESLGVRLSPPCRDRSPSGCD